MKTVLTLFGTRPEIIKLAPVIWSLESRGARLRNLNVCSSQHTDLIRPFISELKVRIDHDLAVMMPSQTIAEVLARVVQALTTCIEHAQPDLLIVQGDTTTAIAGALAAFYSRVPVGHVEAGLRTNHRGSPFPEEMNRRLITQVADLHFAATQRNVRTLQAEGVRPERIVLTGNPVVDTLQRVVSTAKPSTALSTVLERAGNRRIVVLTTHRRENFGSIMTNHLRALRRFLHRHDDLVLIFPVHPNPAVRQVVTHELGGWENILQIEPLEYADFLYLLSKAWMIVSDSGGIQEEAPSLGKPLLILRDTTERPEVIESGVGRLVGHSGERLEQMLEEALGDEGWARCARTQPNPFGDGAAGERIAKAIEAFLGSDTPIAPGWCST